MRTQILNPISSTATLNDGRTFHSKLKKDMSAPESYFVEETLVVDERAARRPAQTVEDKLSQMLKTCCIGVSQLRLKGLLMDRTK